MATDDPTRIRSSRTSLEIVEAVNRRGGATLTELAEDFDLSKAGLLKHLRTLSDTGYLIREGNTYHIGLKFLPLALRAREKIELYSVARPEIEKLSQASGEQANILVEQAGRGIYIFAVNDRANEAPSPDEGTIVSLTETAAGKAILSQFPEERRKAVSVEGVATDQDLLTELDAELSDARNKTLAYDRGQNRFDKQSVATPILDEDGSLLGAVELVGPESRVTDKRLEEDFPGLILSTAAAIEDRVRSA